MNDWISVSDFLPGKKYIDHPILVYSFELNYITIIKYEKDIFDKKITNGIKTGVVSHWKPLCPPCIDIEDMP